MRAMNHLNDLLSTSYHTSINEPNCGVRKSNPHHCRFEEICDRLKKQATAWGQIKKNDRIKRIRKIAKYFGYA